MKSVFLDTVGLLAIRDRRDRWHAIAMKAFEELSAQGANVMTSELVLLECANAASRLAYRSRVVELRQTLLPKNRILTATEQELNSAWLEYSQQQTGKSWCRRSGFVRLDASSRHGRSAHQ